MKYLRPAAGLAALLVCGLAIADNSGGERSATGKMVLQDDWQRIQGTWLCISVEEDGKTDGAGTWRNAFLDNRWTYEGEFMWHRPLNGEKLKFVVDPTKVLPVQTLIYDLGKGIREPFLYDFRDDRMRWCFWPNNKELPTTFDSKDGRIILTLKRVATPVKDEPKE